MFSRGVSEDMTDNRKAITMGSIRIYSKNKGKARKK